MATTDPVNIMGTTTVKTIHLNKAELTQFQCVVAVVAYEAITESLSKQQMQKND